VGKGVKKDALANSGKANNLSDQFNTQGKTSYNELFPFLSGEITNPQGFGDDTVSKMLTEGAQTVGGEVGAAGEKANLLASRTGNTAALPAIIGDVARSGMKQQSDNALGIAIANAQQKEKQRQAGAAGVGSMYDQQTTDALKALGLSNESLDVANHASPSAWQQAGQLALNNVANNLTKGLGSGLSGMMPGSS
jgi:hypothetical protein